MQGMSHLWGKLDVDLNADRHDAGWGETKSKLSLTKLNTKTSRTRKKKKSHQDKIKVATKDQSRYKHFLDRGWVWGNAF